MHWDIIKQEKGLIIHSGESQDRGTVDGSALIYDQKYGNGRMKASCIITNRGLYRLRHPIRITLREAKSAVRKALLEIEENPNDKHLELSFLMADYLTGIDWTAIYMWELSTGACSMIAYRSGYGINFLRKHGRAKLWHPDDWRQSGLTSEEVKKRMLQSARRTAKKAEPQLSVLTTGYSPWSWKTLYLS